MLMNIHVLSLGLRESVLRLTVATGVALGGEKGKISCKYRKAILSDTEFKSRTVRGAR